MRTTTVRVSSRAHGLLQEMARAEGVSMQEVLDEAVETYRRQQLLRATNEAYAAVRKNAKAWGAVQAERAEWDTTVADGLEAD